MNLDELRNIIGITKLPGVKPLPNIFKRENKESKQQVLFNGIEDNDLITEEKAAESLYNSTPLEKLYTTLKANLADTLAHDISYFDFSKRFSSLTNNTLGIWRTYVGVRILLAANLGSIASGLAKRLYDEATRYDVTEIRLNCLRILREDAHLEGEAELYNKYNTELQILQSLFAIELQAEAEYQRIEANYITSASRSPSVAEEAFKYEDYLNDVCTFGTTSSIELSKFRILLLALQITNCFSEADKVCKKAIDYLDSKPSISNKARQAEFIHTAMTCSLMLKNYPKAIENGRQLLNLDPKGSSNWYKVLFKMIIAALHISDYNLAVELYSLGAEQKKLHKLLPFEQQKWQLCKAYIALLFESKSVINTDKKFIKEFNLSTLMSSLPELIKDKGGLNIPIHVLQILFYLQIHKYANASEKIDYFKRYVYRCLDEKEYSRTYTFLTMLKILRKVHYDTGRAEQLCQKYYEELSCTPEKPEQFIEFNEIIPYDMLWHWILKNCKPGKFEVV